MYSSLIVLLVLWLVAAWLYGIVAVCTVAERKNLSVVGFLLAAVAFLPVAAFHVHALPSRERMDVESQGTS